VNSYPQPPAANTLAAPVNYRYTLVMMKRQRAPETPNVGTVIAVRGSVVDAQFPDQLPNLYQRLSAEGPNGPIVVEVATHLGNQRVRGIALTPTQGLARGDAILDEKRPLQVPVGQRVLGRIFNVFGETLDNLEPLSGGEWRSIHQPSIPLHQRAVQSEIFATGIKAIDVLTPLERGGAPGCSAAPAWAKPC
jgi:F-type H+/Na+-transporting ATPase subunit beta